MFDIDNEGTRSVRLTNSNSMAGAMICLFDGCDRCDKRIVDVVQGANENRVMPNADTA